MKLKKKEFEDLKQGSMTVSEYVTPQGTNNPLRLRHRSYSWNTMGPLTTSSWVTDQVNR
jgi:hypothetical protein